jgi:hypothetical protein
LLPSFMIRCVVRSIVGVKSGMITQRQRRMIVANSLHVKRNVAKTARSDVEQPPFLSGVSVIYGE